MNMNLTYSLILVGVVAITAVPRAADNTGRCFELRTYYAAPGKLEDLHARFRSHTMKIFEKHGMINVGYWVPMDNPDHKLIYLLEFPSRAAQRQAWRDFGADPEWRAVVKTTEANGRLVTKVDSLLLKPTDYSPAVEPKAASPARCFELRTYTASEDNLDKLNARFRDHTLALFAKHGLKSVAYWTPLPPAKGADNTLVYILAHPSKDAAAESWKAFREDPDWVAAKKASEVNGSLTTKVESVYMSPTDYSPMK